jgi:hypothetical protein
MLSIELKLALVVETVQPGLSVSHIALSASCCFAKDGS